MVLGGLTQEEWGVWQEKFLHVGARPSTQAEKDELSALTGLVPLYLQFWNQDVKDTDTFETVRDRFLASCGNTIQVNLRNFTDDVTKKPKHIAMMAAAIGGTTADVDRNLFDQRYFYVTRKEPRNIIPISELVCVCGLDLLGIPYVVCLFVCCFGFFIGSPFRQVRHGMATVLRETHREQFFSTLTPQWVCDALKTANSNPSVRGFAFEQYAIATLARYPSMICPVGDTVKIEHFEGTGPPTSLNDKDAVLYIPKRWNYKHIDCLLRVVRPVVQERKPKKPKKPKIETKEVLLFPI